ncbi:uncharacterized protein LOC108670650 [Hyalella azteca]|uniref:Uncharacterized protein LOC108670650 n=1 Tax=Hyalella azteca TaxID=294128 RepID=A0A979FWI7_HYAAZ|nr:uncharacterized protein LOC108670650 [Hyalella azteca]
MTEYCDSYGKVLDEETVSNNTQSSAKETDCENEVIARPFIEENGLNRPVSQRIVDLAEAILSLQSPDDLDVHTLAAQIRSISNELDYKWLCTQICSAGSSNRRAASVVAAVCRETATHAVGATKMRSLLFRTAQSLYDEHDLLSKTDHKKFVTGTLFLGELFYYVKSESGSPFAVLAQPLVMMLDKILQKYLMQPHTLNRHHLPASQHSCKKQNISSPTRLLEKLDISHDSESHATKMDNITRNEESVNPRKKDNSVHYDPLASKSNSCTETKDCVPKNESVVNSTVSNDGNVVNDLDDRNVVTCNERENYDEFDIRNHDDDHFNDDNNEGRVNVDQDITPDMHESPGVDEDVRSLAEQLDEDVMVVARQLLQNGEWLLRLCPDGVARLVQGVTELLCRACLSSTATLQVASALAEMWPLLSPAVHPRTSHAVLAAKMGLSLNL